MRSPAARVEIAVTVSTPPPRALSPVSVSAFYIHSLCPRGKCVLLTVRLMSSSQGKQSKGTEIKTFNQDGNYSQRQPDFVA